MVEKRYDIIIVGAGVSGLMLAEMLNDSKLEVLLIEKRPTIRKLINYRYGTFKETVEKFNLQKFVIAKYNKFGIRGIEQIARFSYEEPEFQVVDMNLYAKKLKLKCDVKTGYDIRTVERRDKKIIINDEYASDIVVDCTGCYKIIAYKLGLAKHDTTECYSTSYELKRCKIDMTDEMWFVADLRYGSLGIWFYPYSQTTSQLGQSDFFSNTIPLPPNQQESIVHYMKNEEPFKTWFQKAKIHEKLAKIGPTTTLTTISDDNFLACGDAAGAGTPYIAEGFRISLEMAESAYQTIKFAFEKKDFSNRTLKKHQKKFHKTLGKNYLWSVILRWIILRYFTNKEFDLFLKNINELSPEKFKRALASYIDLPIILKSLKGKLVFFIFINFFRYHFGRKPLYERMVK